MCGVFVCAATPEEAPRNLGGVFRAFRHASYQIIPIPIVASDPAEGQTYGALPVLLALDEHGEMFSILATAFTYNDTTKYGGFANWILSPSRDEELRFYGGAAQNFYREASADYVNRRWHAHHLNFQTHFLYLEDPFERFFGFGPRTLRSAESNFTSLYLRGNVEAAVEFFPHLSATSALEWSRVRLQPAAVSGVADTSTRYGADPQVAASHQMIYRAGVRYDSRDNDFFPTRGIMASAQGLLSHAVAGPDTFFGGYELRSKFAWQPHSRFTTVGSWRWQQLFGARVPIYLQSSLGGEKELRGFMSRRFTDRHATVLDLEERMLIKEWRIFGAQAAFSIDPFFSVGQVFHDFRDLRAHNLEPTGGVGFRMRSPPAVLGRVDIAYGRDGLAIYTMLDYPF